MLRALGRAVRLFGRLLRAVAVTAGRTARRAFRHRRVLWRGLKAVWAWAKPRRDAQLPNRLQVPARASSTVHSVSRAGSAGECEGVREVEVPWVNARGIWTVTLACQGWDDRWEHHHQWHATDCTCPRQAAEHKPGPCRHMQEAEATA